MCAECKVLVNNAGVGGSLVAVEEMPEEGFRAIMDANFFGPIRLSKLVIPAMRARGDGVILNVSSVLGRVATMCQVGFDFCTNTAPPRGICGTTNRDCVQYAAMPRRPGMGVASH